ncbi:MAG: NAD+ synthase [Bacteroidetes bacterium]|nr:NAD+ synthase [Bacteroidota bacterium]
MRVALAQLNYHIGNFESNTAKVIRAIRQARENGAELVLFAELAVSGYPPRDFLEFDDFIDRCYRSLETIARECTDIAAIIGSPSRNPGNKGKPLFNTAFFLYHGKIEDMRHKTLLPTYDVFDEYRYFEPNRLFNLLEFKGKRLALTICEDLWIEGTHPLYTLDPMEELIKQEPDIMINIAASPFHYSQAETRLKVLKANVLKYRLPVVYVNHVGAQTELLFDGGSLAMNKEGDVINSLRFFGEDMGFVNLEEDNQLINKEISSNKGGIIQIPEKISLIHDALVMGIQDYFGKLGFSKAVIGLSGGIDSALVLVLAAKALGADNVLSVLMPSAFSSDHSVNDALALVENLSSPYEKIPIEDIFQQFNQSLSPVFKGLPFNLAEENIQARVRAVILMALSNKMGYILLNTSNKSEAAVGYGTLYGDMCGAISVLGDVYKTEVYELAGFINKDRVVIPENILLKPPSAELRPDQKDSDSLPDYAILDQILYQYIEKRKGPDDLLAMGFDKDTVLKTLKMVNTSEHKRYQTPPVLRVSPKAFGMGRRMPIVAKYLS